MINLKKNKFLKKLNEATLSHLGFDLICLLLLTVLLVYILYFVNFTNKDERIGAIILSITAVAIIQYTKETYKLRKTNKWLVDNSEEANQISVKPVLSLRFLGTSHRTTRNTDDIAIYLKNIGKGTATNIRWRIQKEEQLANKDWFHRSLNQGMLPKLWQDSGFQLTLFRKSDYLDKDLWRYELCVEYDWAFGKNQVEVLPLDMDYYISSDIPKEWREMIDEVWVKAVVEKLAKENLSNGS